MTLSAYSSVNLGKASEASKDLFERLARETDQTSIVLTPVYNTDGTPPFLTQEMAAWLASYVQPSRSGALQEVTDEFKRHNCKLIEQEIEVIENKKLADVANERALLRLNKDVEFLRNRYVVLRTDYDALRLNYGRDARPWTPVRYWIVLFCFMFPEFLINWDSFLKIPGFTPAYATGLILVVAIAFAFSAHSIGRIVKQWKDLFGGHVELTDKTRIRRELSVGILLFLLGIIAVGWGRWYFIQGAILEKSILRGGGLDFNDLLQFGGAMLGNVLVYLLGFLWSFMKHDAIPDYSELRYDLMKTQNRLAASFEKYLTRRNQQHFQRAQKDKAQAQRFEDSQKKREGYIQARQAFTKLRNKDAEVLALLKEYRNRLLAKLKSDPNPKSLQIDDVRMAEFDTVVRLTPEQYASVPLEMGYV
jgi:hypothetical protein